MRFEMTKFTFLDSTSSPTTRVSTFQPHALNNISTIKCNKRFIAFLHCEFPLATMLWSDTLWLKLDFHMQM